MPRIETTEVEQDNLLVRDFEEAKQLPEGVQRDQVISLVAIGAMQQNQLELALEAISNVSKEKQEALYTQASEMAPGDTDWQKKIEEWRKEHN